MTMLPLPGTTPDPTSRQLGWWVILLAAVVLITMLLATSPRLASDEPWHRMTAYALQEQGLRGPF